MSEVVVFEREGRVARVTLNRPEKLNALNEEVRRGLHDAFTALAESPDTSIVVLSGAGRSFSAGADLTSTAYDRGGGTTWSAERHTYGSWQRLLDLIERVPQVTVAKLHGHCVGGAALLAAACDIRIADESLVVRIPELAIGIPLTWAGIPRLAREIGLPLARDLVMTGRALSADEAHMHGFVQRLAPEGQLDDATDGLLAELLNMPPGPLALTRAMFAAINQSHLGASGWADPDMLRWAFGEEEYRAAARRYIERNLQGK